jgi:hypothetical protein
MAVRIEWHPPLVPEERKKAEWENIIRFELGERSDAVEVGLRYTEDRQVWRVETWPASEAYRGRVVDALRATGKPVE